jgi:Ca-activated chloride channel family protein
MRSRISWVVVALFGGLAAVAASGPRLAASADVQAGSVIVEGTVVDERLVVLAGVKVTLERTGATAVARTTDQAGRYRFEGVAVGGYTIRAELAAFKSFSRAITVRATPSTLSVPIVLWPTTPRSTPSPTPSALPGQAAYAAAPPPAVAGGVAGAGGGRGGGGGRGVGPVLNREAYAHIESNTFKLTTDNPLSTFAADVDTASFTNVRRFLNQGQLPPPDAVRVEELVNYFRFPYSEPPANQPVSITTDVGDCPWAPGHKLVLVGLRARPISDRGVAGRNIVLLVDVSGSMAPADRLPLVKTALRMFVDTLRDDDRIAMVVYAGASGLALPPTSGRSRQRIHDAIEGLSAGGSTNGAQGLVLAYRTAREEFVPGGINRVILATDGDFNVGVTSDGDLVRLIERERESGVYLSVLGVGTGNLQDAKMEQLADKGNGHYAYLDSLFEARRVLVREGGATLETVAKDVKFQVEFNPAQVAAWKLIGYENRLLANEAFNDDKKDGGELGAGHTVTALYEIVPKGSPLPESLSGSGGRPPVDPLIYQTDRRPATGTTGDLLMVKVRYKRPDSATSELLTRPVSAQSAVRTGTANARVLPFAAAVAEFGMLLRDDKASAARWTDLVGRIKTLPWPAEGAADREALADLVGLAAGLKKIK